MTNEEHAKEMMNELTNFKTIIKGIISRRFIESSKKLEKTIPEKVPTGKNEDFIKFTEKYSKDYNSYMMGVLNTYVEISLLVGGFVIEVTPKNDNPEKDQKVN